MTNYAIVLDINGEDHEVKISDITKAICEQYSDNYPEIFTVFVKTMLKWDGGYNRGSEYLKMLLPLYKATVNQLPVETSEVERCVLRATHSILKEQERCDNRRWGW